MPKFNYLDRINYGPHKGGYDYNGNGWTGHFYRLTKNTELGTWDLTIIDPETDEVVGTRRQATVSEADRYIGSLVGPLRRARQAEEEAERQRVARERAEQAARERAERLATDSHKDSDLIIRSKITRQDAIKLAERLLHWAVDSNKNEPMDTPVIDFTIHYTESTRAGTWRHDDENDDRMSVGIGWTSSDDVYPIIEDSLVTKRRKAEAVTDDENLGVAV